MPFIGIVAKESDSNFIKNELLKNSFKTKFEIININKESIQNLKNIKFETIVICDEFSNFLRSSKYLEEIIRNAKYIVINSDIINENEIITEGKKVTYGLNQNAMITISSIKQENILICIQKQLKNIKEKIVEEQEINIQISKNSSKKICNSMAIFTILVIYGEFLKKI